MPDPKTKEPGTKVQTTQEEIPMPQRFAMAVAREFSTAVGTEVQFTDYQRILAQHLFLKIEASMFEQEKKRQKNNEKQNMKPIVWENVNMAKLAIDSMRRIDVGLDATIENHISPIAYWNSALQKYDVDLRVGYVGKDYYKRKFALDPPEKPPIYQLVYKNDIFKPLMKNANRDVEGYEFEIPQPFDRGEIIGGFAYFMYQDETKNKLYFFSEEDFKDAESYGNKQMWKDRPTEMRYKTIVNRATNKLFADPKKVNASYIALEEDEVKSIEYEVTAEIAEKANKQTLELSTTPSGDPVVKGTGEILESGVKKEGKEGTGGKQTGLAWE